MTPNPSSRFSFRGRTIRVSNLRIAAVVSLVVHALLFWSPASKMVFDKLQPFESKDEGQPAGSLAVRLVVPTHRRADETPQVPEAPVMSAPRKVAPRQAPPAPKVAAAPPVLSQPSPSPTRAPSAPAQAPAAAASAPTGDLAAFVEQRRRARESNESQAVGAPPVQPAPPAETEQERDNRLAAERLGFNNIPTFGAGKKTGGGVFQMERVGMDSAEFFYFGWNKAIRRNSQQMIEVRRGDNPTIELAVVRRMIAIIREQSSGDFVWESHRLRRDVTLSARPADNAGLEDFLMKEFFSDRRR